jgi:hypothetical protein
MKKGEMLGTMLVIATNAHAGQFDRGGAPYILHPLKVMHYLKSERVIAGIRALTKQPGQTYEEYKAGVFASEDAMRVKLADLRHNTDIRRLKGVTEKDIARMAKYHMFYMEIKSRLVDH